jgi:hypothetical protein
MDFQRIKELQDAYTANRLARLAADVEMLELTLQRTCYGPDQDACQAIVKRLADAARCHLQEGGLDARTMRGIIQAGGAPAND